jgi:hypothetical protein
MTQPFLSSASDSSNRHRAKETGNGTKTRGGSPTCATPSRSKARTSGSELGESQWSHLIGKGEGNGQRARARSTPTSP